MVSTWGRRAAFLGCLVTPAIAGCTSSHHAASAHAGPAPMRTLVVPAVPSSANQRLVASETPLAALAHRCGPLPPTRYRLGGKLNGPLMGNNSPLAIDVAPGTRFVVWASSRKHRSGPHPDVHHRLRRLRHAGVRGVRVGHISAAVGRVLRGRRYVPCRRFGHSRRPDTAG